MAAQRTWREKRMAGAFILSLALCLASEISAQAPEGAESALPWRVVKLGTGEVGILRPSGWVNRERWKDVSPLDQGVATARRSLWKGHFTVEGKLLDADAIPVEGLSFDDILPFREDMAAVKIGESWGFIDRKGKVVIEPLWEEVLGFVNGESPVRKDGKWGFINQQGVVVIPPKWDEARGFPSRGESALARVRQGKLWGFINRRGEEVIPIIYSAVMPFHAVNTLVRDATEDAHWRLIDPGGETIGEQRWEFVEVFPSEAVPAPVCDLKGRWGFLSADGSYLIEPQWDWAWGFSEGYAVVRKEGKHGIIDLEGRVVIEPTWDRLEEVSEGFSVAWRENLAGFIEIPSGRIIEPQWKHAYRFEHGFGLVMEENQYALLQPDGTVAGDWVPKFP